METRLRNILRTTNVIKFIKTILESSFKVLLGTYILVASTRPVVFFKGRWVLSNFWHLDCYNACYILRKIAKFFRNLTQTSENAPKIISIGLPITEKRPFKNLKILSSLAPFISEIKRADIFNFLSVKYFDKRLSFQKFDIYGSSIVEITGRPTCYFVSLDTSYSDLKTDKRK